jgi:hypothetical protein
LVVASRDAPGTVLGVGVLGRCVPSNCLGFAAGTKGRSALRGLALVFEITVQEGIKSMAASETPTLVSGDKTVTAAGTAEALATTQRVRSVTLVAKDNNTGRVFVGGADVASSTNRGLLAGDVLTHSTASGWLNLADIYVDASVSGEGVDYYAVKA